MRNGSKVFLVGHVAADPESSEAKTGIRVIFPLAAQREFTSAGVKQQVTDFHRVVAWGKLAEICAKNLTKGHRVYVEGILFNRPKVKEGERKYVSEIRAWEIHALAGKKTSGIDNRSVDAIKAD
jgi:single-strand DNA-binding protein